MHILEFFELSEQREIHPFEPGMTRIQKLDALLDASVLADPAYDSYMRTALRSVLECSDSADFLLASLLQFGARQLSRRQDEPTDPPGGQPLVQFGPGSGACIAAACVRNPSTKVYVVNPGGPPPGFEQGLASLQRTNLQTPCYRDQALIEYIDEIRPAFGVLLLSGLARAEEYQQALQVAWPYIHENGDVILEGDQDVLLPVLQALDAEMPDLRGAGRPGFCIRDGEVRQHFLGVFQRKARVYCDEHPSLTDYRPQNRKDDPSHSGE